MSKLQCFTIVVTMQARFTTKKQHNYSVWSFSFTPAGPFAWQAGQSLRLEIAGPYGPLEHRFSIASPPSSGLVTVTTRLSGSDYKDSLAELQPGDTVQLQGLEGNFIWHDRILPHIFVAAGIGITPFHAIIAERHTRGEPTPATLIYSSHDEPAVYAEQLQSWANNAELTVLLQKARVTAQQILELPHATERLVYISGPSKMVGTLYADLIAAGIAPANILQDHFTGRLSEGG